MAEDYHGYAEYLLAQAQKNKARELEARAAKQKNAAGEGAAFENALEEDISFPSAPAQEPGEEAGEPQASLAPKKAKESKPRRASGFTHTILFMCGLICGLAVAFGMVLSFSPRTIASTTVTEVNYVEALAVAVNEIWWGGRMKTKPARVEGYYPLLVKMELSDSEMEMLLKATTPIPFTYISNWQEIDFSRAKKPEDIITTVVSYVELDMGHGYITVGLRKGLGKYLGVKYKLRRRDAVWAVVGKTGDITEMPY